MRSLIRLGIVVETISGSLRELARTPPDLHARTCGETIRRSVDRDGTGAFATSVSRRRLGEAGRGVIRSSW